MHRSLDSEEGNLPERHLKQMGCTDVSAGAKKLPEQENRPTDHLDAEREVDQTDEDAEAPNSLVVGAELQDDDAPDEQLISGGMPD